MALSARHASFVAAAVFAGLAVFIARLAAAPLVAADLLGIAACAAAAGAFATLAFTLRPTPSASTASVTLVAANTSAPTAPTASGASPAPPPALAPSAAEIAAAVDSRVAAVVETRLAAALPALADQLATALAAAQEKRATARLADVADAPAPVPAPEAPALTIDTIAPPASGARPRLGRGLLGLMHDPAALAKPAAARAPSARPADGDADESERAAA